MLAISSVGSNQTAPSLHHKPRTVVVDDSVTILHAICSLLEHSEIVEVVGRAESAHETIAAVLDLHPEVVLLDADMPGMSGLRAALLISHISPETKIILMSMDSTPEFLRACAGCGAHAVIYKPRFLKELANLLADGHSRERKKPASRSKRKAAAPATIMG